MPKYRSTKRCRGIEISGIRKLFEAAGLKFDFSEKTLRPLIETAMEEIDRL